MSDLSTTCMRPPLAHGPKYSACVRMNHQPEVIVLSNAAGHVAGSSDFMLGRQSAPLP
jgi:hypothetical protein